METDVRPAELSMQFGGGIPTILLLGTRLMWRACQQSGTSVRGGTCLIQAVRNTTSGTPPHFAYIVHTFDVLQRISRHGNSLRRVAS